MGFRLDARPSGIRGRAGLGVRGPERAGSGLDIHGPGEADGEVLLSYVVMFHKMRLLDLYKTLKK